MGMRLKREDTRSVISNCEGEGLLRAFMDF